MATESRSTFTGELPRLVRPSTMDNYFGPLSPEEQEEVMTEAARIYGRGRRSYPSRSERISGSRAGESFHPL